VLDKWDYENRVALDFSRPGKPTDNALIESFNGGFRTSVNVHWFLSLRMPKRRLRSGELITMSFDHTALWVTGRPGNLQNCIYHKAENFTFGWYNLRGWVTRSKISLFGWYSLRDGSKAKNSLFGWCSLRGWVKGRKISLLAVQF